jgi:chloride channel protein, CIC family
VSLPQQPKATGGGSIAPEAKGHGVPEVMDAIYYREGIIRPIVVLVRSLASAVAIGSGGDAQFAGKGQPMIPSDIATDFTSG